MARQIHLSYMSGLNKSYGTKKVLENVNLSFYPDAKIGILGPNGAGKSTVLRIMAGLDKEYTGEAWVAQGADRRLSRAGNRSSIRPRRRWKTSWKAWRTRPPSSSATNELMMNYSDETAEEGLQAPGHYRRPEPVGSRKPGRNGDGSAALPAWRCGCDQPVGW